MTYIKISDKKPKRILLDEEKKNISFIIHGQGVFIFKNKDNTQDICFQLYNKDKNKFSTLINILDIKKNLNRI